MPLRAIVADDVVMAKTLWQVATVTSLTSLLPLLPDEGRSIEYLLA